MKDAQEIARTKAAKDGSFQFAFYTERITSLELYSEKGIIIYDLYIGPGDSLSFKLKNKLFKIKYAFDGNVAQVNASRFIYVDRFYFNQEYRNSFKSMNIDSFSRYIDNRRSEQLHFWDSLLTSGEITRPYYNYMTRDANYSWAVDKLQYLWKHPYMNGNFETMTPAPEYYDFLEEAEIDADSAFRVSSYTNFLNAFTIDLLMQEAKKLAENEAQQQELYKHSFLFIAKKSDEYISGRNRDLLFACLANEMLERMNEPWADSTEMDSFITLYHLKKTDPGFRKLIEEAAEQYYHRLAVPVFPEFTVAGKHGKKVQIADFRGKVVYIDFWATNCAPCIKAIPESNALQERLKGEDVVFLMVAFDISKKQWKKVVKKQEFRGLHTITPDEPTRNYLYQTFSFSGYPHYAIIGRDGYIKITNANPPGEDAFHQIKEELAK